MIRLHNLSSPLRLALLTAVLAACSAPQEDADVRAQQSANDKEIRAQGAADSKVTPAVAVRSEHDRPGFATKVEDGRLWVFRAGSKDLADFEKHGEPAKVVIRPGAGPNRMTVKSTDAATIDAYLAAE